MLVRQFMGLNNMVFRWYNYGDLRDKSDFDGLADSLVMVFTVGGVAKSTYLSIYVRSDMKVDELFRLSKNKG